MWFLEALIAVDSGHTEKFDATLLTQDGYVLPLLADSI